MKSMSSHIFFVGMACVASCTPKQVTKTGNSSGSNLKTVTINQPDLKKEMKDSLKQDEKDKVFSSLVYQIVINAQKKDGKDDCATGVTPTMFNSGVVAIDKKDFAEIKIVKGCSYLVSMKIGAKSEDGKMIKTPYLSSWDDKDPSVLTKEELEKAKPTVSVRLYVTADGKPYWDAESIVTPADTDTNIDPQIVKPGKVSAMLLDLALDDKTNMVSGKVDVTPKMASSVDLYCAVGAVVELSNDKSEKKFIKVRGSGTAESAVSKIDANVSAKQSIAISANSTGYNKISSSKPYVFCGKDRPEVVSRYTQCLVNEMPEKDVSCDETSIAN